MILAPSRELLFGNVKTIMQKEAMRKFVVMGLAFLPLASAQADEAMSGDHLRAAVAGKTIYVSSPLGEIPIRYSVDGTMTGQTELALLDGESRTSDKGHWWIAENKLCVKWRSWMGAKPYCFTMHRLGGSTVRWHRNDGKIGTARLG